MVCPGQTKQKEQLVIITKTTIEPQPVEFNGNNKKPKVLFEFCDFMRLRVIVLYYICGDMNIEKC